ncbi:MAG: sigma 54-interacting transcriptional regulator [Desulfuromusa sp.]|nr:sigma 54-interacting transcriptional regulator [Desulfuromusa sp.]
MTSTQKLKLSDLKPFLDHLTALDSPDLLFKLIKELTIAVDLPEVDEKELILSFSDHTLKISRKQSVEETPIHNAPGSIIAEDSKTKVALGIVVRMATTDDPVVICGESGTGKDLFARTIHQQSPRRTEPFVSLHCGTIGEKETKQRIITALVEVGTGTLFLDNIQNLDMDSQKILRKIIHNPVEQKYFRLITATNVDLDEQVRKGGFSAELLAILSGCYIELLPLEERKEDIGALLTYYIDQLCRSRGMEVKCLSPELLRILEAYHWPGNVRELVNTVKQLLITAQEKKTLFAKDLPAHIRIKAIESLAADKKGL